MCRELLQQYGMHLTAEGIGVCLQEIRRRRKNTQDGESKSSNPSVQEVHDHVANRTLRGISEGFLQEATSSAECLKGLHVVQVVKARDALLPMNQQHQSPKVTSQDSRHNNNSKSQRGSHTTRPAKRMLSLVVSDGVTRVNAFECSPVPALSLPNLAPGTKIALKDCPVTPGKTESGGGLLMLSANNVVRVFGRVASLHRAWVMRDKAEAHREMQSSLEKGEKPAPKFTPYEDAKFRNVDIFGGQITHQVSIGWGKNERGGGGGGGSGNGGGGGHYNREGKEERPSNGRNNNNYGRNQGDNGGNDGGNKKNYGRNRGGNGGNKRNSGNNHGIRRGNGGNRGGRKNNRGRKGRGRGK